jgi:hypothetical protein
MIIVRSPDGMERFARSGMNPRQTGIWWDTRGGGRGAIAGIADIARHRRDRNAPSTKTADAGCQDTIFDNVGGGSVWI